MKPQVLLAEGNNTKSPLIVFEAKTLRDSKHMEGSVSGFLFLFFLLCAVSVLKAHVIVDSCLRSHSSQHIPGDKKE